MNKKIMYVVFIESLTNIGKLAYKLTGYKYSHIAVSFDEKLTDFVTFSRLKHNYPFNAGFKREIKEYYIFKEKDIVELKIFKIPLTKKAYTNIQKFINIVEKDQEYMFNIFSMLLMPFKEGFDIYKTYNCMSFIADLLKLTECVKLEKETYKYSNRQLEKTIKNYYYKTDYLKNIKPDLNYMKKGNVFINIYTLFKVIFKLSYRLIFKRKEKSWRAF